MAQIVLFLCGFRASSRPRVLVGLEAQSSMILRLPVDAHPCSAPADSALHRLTEAAYTAICIASMVSAAP